MITARNEVQAVRLYSKTPGTDRLRRSALGELRQMIAAGWQETQRTINVDHVLVRMERPVPKVPHMTAVRPGEDPTARRRR
ncbi:MAG TPA: hypothetical protein VGR20_14075 [Acidimicrobiia bacterium]|nr:hypothetical protein [Acidimicrobiia bacterium]